MLRLGSDLLGGAVNNLAIVLGTLDQPVVGTVARNALGHAVLAEIEIAIVASRAVIVNMRCCLFAAIAADGETRNFDRGFCGHCPHRRWWDGPTEHVGLSDLGCCTEGLEVVRLGHSRGSLARARDGNKRLGGDLGGGRRLEDLLNRDGLGPSRSLLRLQRDAELELRLGLRGAVELLVNGGIVRLEEDVGGSGVGVPLENDGSFGRDVKKLADLYSMRLVMIRRKTMVRGWRPRPDDSLTSCSSTRGAVSRRDILARRVTPSKFTLTVMTASADGIWVAMFADEYQVTVEWCCSCAGCGDDVRAALRPKEVPKRWGREEKSVDEMDQSQFAC